MDLSLSASQLITSTVSPTSLTPFADLDYFIALCETPARVLPRSDSDQPLHTTDNTIGSQDLYIVVPTPPKYSKPFPTNVQFCQSMISQDNAQDANIMVVKPETFSFAFLNPRAYINFFRKSMYPFIIGIIFNTIRAMILVLNMVKFLSIYSLSLAKAITVKSFQATINIISSFFSFFKSILLLAVRVALITIDIISSIWSYIDSIPLINLYLKPIYYLSMLSAIVGSAIGLWVGFIVLAIRYLIPTTSKKTEQELVARSMIKSFKNSLSVQQSNLKLQSRVPSTTKIKHKQGSDSNYTIVSGTASAAVNSTAMPVNPTSLSTATTLNNTNNATSAASLPGKHEASTSNCEENEKIKTKPLSSSFRTDQPINDLECYGFYVEIPSITPPMYEDEDGYSNYFIRSAAPGELSPHTPADSPTLQSPALEVKNSRNDDFSSKSTTLSKGLNLSCGNENGNIDDDDDDDGDDDDDDNTIYEIPKTPVGKIIYSSIFESIAEESD
jgi:hypothetical protein